MIWNLPNEAIALSHNVTPVDLESTTADYYLDYDYDEHITSVNITEYVFTSLAYCIVLTVGLVSNLTFLAILIRCPVLHTRTNIFLVSLSIADLLVICICIPVKLAQIFAYSWSFGRTMCKLYVYVHYAAALSSAWHLAVFSIERYIAVTKPFLYREAAMAVKRFLIPLWCFAFVGALPIIHVQAYIEVGERKVAYWCVRNWDTKLEWCAFELYALTVILILPLSVMSISYWKTGQSLRTYFAKPQKTVVISKHQLVPLRRITTLSLTSRQQQNLPENDDTKEILPRRRLCYRKHSSRKDKTTRIWKTLLVLVVVFLICWGPILIMNVLTAFDVVTVYNHIGWNKTVRIGFHLLSYVNSAINPFAYSLLTTEFKKRYAQFCRF